VSSLEITAIVFVCVFGGVLIGVGIRRILPEHHLSSDSRDVVKLGMGFIATLTAMVLGLLIATAKSTYDTQNATVKELSTRVILLDRTLAIYGPETKEARGLLHISTESTLHHLWPDDKKQHADLTPGESRGALETMYEKISALTPQTDTQKVAKARAMDLTVELAQTRLRLFAQQETSLPAPFFIVLVFWLIVLFAGYGTLTPTNATVLVVLTICSLSVSAAVFLMLELTTPFTGTIRIPSVPLSHAFTLLGQ